MLNVRQKVLLDYFLDVTRDLVHRGGLRKEAGQSFIDVLKLESRAVLVEVSEDVLVVMQELGIGLIGGLEIVARKQVNRAIGGGARILSEMLSGLMSGAKR